MKSCEILGHKFEARYDEKQSNYKLENVLSRDLRSLMFYNVYIHDICTRCGEVIKREVVDGVQNPDSKAKERNRQEVDV